MPDDGIHGQDDSICWEQPKHDDTLPIAGVKTFFAPDAGERSS